MNEKIYQQKLDASFITYFLYWIIILFTLWPESIKHFSENSKGNMIFLYGFYRLDKTDDAGIDEYEFTESRE